MKKIILILMGLAIVGGCALFPVYFLGKANEIATGGASWELVGSANFSQSANFTNYKQGVLSLAVQSDFTNPQKLLVAYVDQAGEVMVHEYDLTAATWHDWGPVANNVFGADSLSVEFMTSNGLAIPHVAFDYTNESRIYYLSNQAWPGYPYALYSGTNRITLLQSDYTSWPDSRSAIIGNSASLQLLTNYFSPGFTILGGYIGSQIQASRIISGNMILTGFYDGTTTYYIELVEMNPYPVAYEVSNITQNPGIDRFGLGGTGYNHTNFSIYWLHEQSGVVKLELFYATNYATIWQNVLNMNVNGTVDLDLVYDESSFTNERAYFAILDSSGAITVYKYEKGMTNAQQVGPVISDINAACMDLAIDNSGNDLYIAYVNKKNSDRVEVRHYRVR